LLPKKAALSWFDLILHLAKPTLCQTWNDLSPSSSRAIAIAFFPEDTFIRSARNAFLNAQYYFNAIAFASKKVILIPRWLSAYFPA